MHTKWANTSKCVSCLSKPQTPPDTDSHEMKQAIECLSLAWVVLFLILYTPAAIAIGLQLKRVVAQYEGKGLLVDHDRRTLRFIQQSLRLFTVRASFGILWGTLLFGLVSYLTALSFTTGSTKGLSPEIIGFVTAIQAVNSFFGVSIAFVHLAKLFLQRRETHYQSQSVRMSDPRLPSR